MIIFPRKYTKSEQDKIISSIIIISDSREKKNAHITNYFDKENIKYKIEGLGFADYTMIIPANDEFDIKEDILFHDHISIERKNSVDEIAGCVTKTRKQFFNEYERHKGFMIVMIEQESGYKDICDGNYRSKVSPSSILGTLQKWQYDHSAPYIFIPKELSGKYIFDAFKYYLKHCFDKQ